MGIEPALARPDAEAILALARDSERASLPEATVVYANVLFGQLGEEAVEGSPLSQWISTPEVQDVAERLRVLAQEIVTGKLPSLGATIPVARVALALLSATIGLRAVIRPAQDGPQPEGDEAATD
jgi:hypothetical protein